MKKFYIFAFAALFVASVAWATLGSASRTTLSSASPTNVIQFLFGAISGVSTADTSNALDAVGYATTRFKVVKTAYRGTFKVTASMDNSTYVTVLQDDEDAAAVTETYYWQNSDGWNYFKIVGDPNGSNAGSVTVSGWLFPKKQGATGFCAANAAPQNLLASSARGPGTPAINPTFKTAGRGLALRINQTADTSGTLTAQLQRVGPTGVKMNVGAPVTITAASITDIVVHPEAISNTTLAFNANVYTDVGNSWFLSLSESGTTTTYSVDVEPIP